MVNYETLQQEVGEWSKHNFGEVPPAQEGQPAHRPLLGLVEEFGELIEAYYKRHIEDLEDAGGDIMVYMADYCARSELDLGRIMDGPSPYVGHQIYPGSVDVELLKLLGKLAHAHLKTEQKIRRNENHAKVKEETLRKLAELARIYLARHGLTLEEAIEKTWGRVSQRDWKKNPITGD